MHYICLENKSYKKNLKYCRENKKLEFGSSNPPVIAGICDT